MTAAVYAAFEEVSDFIKKQPRQAGEVYIRMTNDKRSGLTQWPETDLESRQRVGHDAAQCDAVRRIR